LNEDLPNLPIEGQFPEKQFFSYFLYIKKEKKSIKETVSVYKLLGLQDSLKLLKFVFASSDIS